MSYEGLTPKQARERVSKSSIARLMIEVAMFGRDEFEKCASQIVYGGRDIVEGVVWAWSGIWRIIYMLALYATFPFSKPIMCFLYRRKFRREIAVEAKRAHQRAGKETVSL